MMLHVDVAWAVFFLFKFDCIMSKFEAKIELNDFSFVNYAKTCIKQISRQAEFHSLTAGGAYERAVIRGGDKNAVETF